MRSTRRPSRQPVLTATALTLVLTAAALTLAVAGPAPAGDSDPVPTDVLVRVLAHDAKLVGSGVGGARVTISDAETGEVLARGEHQGGTGDTDVIMRQPQERGGTIYDTEGAAEFRATLHLDAPTRVEIVAEGPLDTPGSLQRATKTLLLVPGFDFVGEGIVLRLYGFRVQLDVPEAVRPGDAIPVRATVRMMCGCPTEPGGLWDADDYTVLARLHQDGEVVSETPMTFAGESSTYEASLPAAAPGPARVEVIAVDPGKANAGRAEADVEIGA